MRFGRDFYKLSGSGNDFVAFDEMRAATADLADPSPERVRALCRRGMGVGADGVMVLREVEGADYRLLYYNADGTRATLCGNASLCSVRLAVELGYASGAGTRFLTDAGPTTGRMVGEVPEIDLAPAVEVELDRSDLLGGAAAIHGAPSRMGFARVGVPHVVILCGDVDAVEVERVAPPIRSHESLRDGANVNYVSRRPGGGWAMRTYERGVEAETLACGTGSVAVATLLRAWGEVGAGEAGAGEAGAGEAGAGEAGVVEVRVAETGVREATEDPGRPASVAAVPVELVTRSGQTLRVRLRPGVDGELTPSLGGAARIVYRGELGEGDW